MLRSIRILTLLVSFGLTFPGWAQPYTPVEILEKPIGATRILQRLSGLPVMKNMGERALEIGPYDEPLCKDCFYLDAFPNLPDYVDRARLIRGDARRLPFAASTSEFVMLKNFPWALPMTVQAEGFEKFLQRHSDAGIFKTREELLEQIEGAHLIRRQVFAEMNRVLADNGVFLVLFSVGGEKPGDLLAYMSHFAEQGRVDGFEVVEAVGILEDRSSLRLQYIAAQYGQGVPVSGLLFYKPGARKKLHGCENVLAAG